MSEINERTRLPLSLIFTIIGLAFSVGVAWAQISDVKMKQDAYMTLLQNIDRRLSNIEGKLEVREQ